MNKHDIYRYSDGHCSYYIGADTPEEAAQIFKGRRDPYMRNPEIDYLSGTHFVPGVQGFKKGYYSKPEPVGFTVEEGKYPVYRFNEGHSFILLAAENIEEAIKMVGNRLNQWKDRMEMHHGLIVEFPGLESDRQGWLHEFK